MVKMGQGIERHIAGGKAADWLGYFLLFASFVVGAAVGGFISLVVNGTWMLVIATVACALTTVYTHFHQDRRALLNEPAEQKASAAALTGALLPMLAGRVQAAGCAGCAGCAVVVLASSTCWMSGFIASSCWFQYGHEWVPLAGKLNVALRPPSAA